MTLPTIHLNGSSKTSLLSEYRAALVAINEAIDKFHKIDFHARDYYVQGPDAFRTARVERDAIGKKLIEIKTYLTDHAVSIKGDKDIEE